MSHPVWVRGLKPMKARLILFYIIVAPRVGAWIETADLRLPDGSGMSHPVWVRGLKPRLK